MTHLSRETLLAWRDHPTDEARALVIGHLAACNACAALYAEILRTPPIDRTLTGVIEPAPAAGAPARFDPAAFVARGLEYTPDATAARTEEPQPAQPRVTRALRWWWVPAAIAAVVLVAVFLRPPTTPAVNPDPVLRGGPGLVAIAPAGDVREVPAFEWQSPSASGVFNVEVVDEAGVVVFERRVSGATRVSAPGDLSGRLQTNVEYRWTVSTLDARGQIVDVSPTVAFRLVR